MRDLKNGIVNILDFRSRKERRSHLRIKVLMDAELYDPRDIVNPVPGLITDISLGGAALSTSRRVFEVDEDVDFHFTFSPGDKLVLLAKVVRISESRNRLDYGFQYFNLTDENRERLKKFIYTLIV